MSGFTPRALIHGMSCFVAKKLAKQLEEKDIEVSINPEEKNFNYIFDFEGEKSIWKKAEEEGSKLTVISVNNIKRAERLKKELREYDVNWRLVESHNVYGPEMEEKGFLAVAMRQTVQNKVLILPPVEIEYRILGVDDLVEAILRASFLSGTEKEFFLILGEKTNSQEIAEVLIDEGKMTQHNVIQEDLDIGVWNSVEVMDNWKRLRWKPEKSFKEGIKETLQFFFAKVDEENRNKTKQELPKKNWEVMPILQQKKERPSKTFEIVVDDKSNEKEIDFSKKLRKIQMVEDLEDEVIEEEPESETTRAETIKKEIQEIKIELPKKKQRFKFNFGFNKGVGLVLSLICILLVIIFPLNWLRVGIFSVKNVFLVEKMVKAKKYDKGIIVTKRWIKSINSTNENINDLGFNRMEWIRNYQNFLRTMGDVLYLESKAIDLIKTSEKLNRAIFDIGDVNWNLELKNIESNLNETQDKIGVLQARLSSGWNWIPKRWREIPKQISGQLDGIKKTIFLSTKALEIIPEFLGIDGTKKEYLVIFQNENEIRPTGGFIGSYGLLDFQGGRLLKFEIKDIYEADGQLKGHVEPPEEIRDYLGEAAWFMRDANWNPDFSKTSKDLQWFLEKEVGRKVDGVIGINLAVVKKLLEATGEIKVPDFNEKINKDNLYEQAEFYAETKFFPGSKQKASFLGALGRQLFEEIKILTTEKKAKFYQAIIDLLETNELQVALNRKEVNLNLSGLGWNGEIYQGKCQTDRCLADYLYLVEANLGVNKANYFLKRSIEQSVDITENTVDRILKINYENTAKSTAWPGGDYKNYLRIYLPIDVSVLEVSLKDGNDLASKKIYGSDEFKITDVNGKKELGFLVMVPVNTKRTVEIKYTSVIDLQNKDKFSYLNYVQRQSGFGETDLVTLISFPKDWQPIQTQPAASLVKDQLLFKQQLDRDLKMGVELGK